MKLLFKSIFILFLLIFSGSSFSNPILSISKIVITGNSTITNETILNIAKISKSKLQLSSDDLNEIKKKIFETNFFSSVDVYVSNNILNILVKENPIVDYVFIQGLSEHPVFKREIEKILITSPNSIFSDSKLNKDINAIKDYLSSKGYFKSVTNFTVKKTSNNFVNVFYDIQLNSKFLIKNIFFIGNKVFPSSTLFSVISSSEDSWSNIFSSNTVPSIDRLNYDMSNLKNFYLSEGYYDVQVSNASIEIIDKNYVNLVFSIDSGKKYNINNLILKNSTNSLNKDNIIFIETLLNKYKNIFYNNLIVNKLRDNIINYIDKIGLQAEVNYNLNKVSENKINVSFEIVEITDKRIVGDIYVVGNDLTEEKVIRNNLLFAEGDVLNQLKIKKSKDLLKSLGLFTNVNIEIIPNTKKDENVKIKVSIQEEPTGEISSGIGIGSAGSNLSFALKERNFLGKGIETNTSLSLGTTRILGVFSFSNPDFYNTGNLVKNSLHVVKYNYENAGYENKLIGDDFSIKYDIYENVSIENGLGVSLDDIKTTTNASTLVSTQAGKYLTTKYFYRLENDERNRKYQTTEGYIITLGQDLAFLPSDVPYLSNYITGTFYKELAQDFTGTIKYKLKSINSFSKDPVKLSDRVFLNDFELRGFAYRGVGPKVDNDYIGGNYAYSTTFSTTVPNGLPDNWGARSNLFVDIGNVWGSDISGVTDSNTIRSSIGIGLNWRSPIGPLSFSYAQPMSKSSTDNVENFNFRLGGTF